MKRLFLIVTFFGIMATGLAQQPDTVSLPNPLPKKINLFTQGNTKNEVGIDVTWFIKNLVNFGSNTGYSNNYIISYKRLLTKNHALRFGIGGNSLNRNQTNSQTNMQDQLKIKSYSFSARLGYEFRNPFGKRWLFYYGGDLLTGYSYTQQNNVHTSTSIFKSEVKSKTFTWGIGPVIGFEFALNSRLSLSTEGSLYFMHSHKKDNYSATNASPMKTINKSSFVTIHTPLSLFINYRF